MRWLHGTPIIHVLIHTCCQSPVCLGLVAFVVHSLTDIDVDVTLQQVRLLMAEEEQAKAEAGTAFLHNVSAGAFLLLGMDIEALQ